MACVKISVSMKIIYHLTTYTDLVNTNHSCGMAKFNDNPNRINTENYLYIINSLDTLAIYLLNV
jgi:hypothetical protein